MSWVENIKGDLIIKLGDGKTYKPDWINASKEVSYNVAEFEFPNVLGTLVKRSKPKGNKYNLEMFFQGEDCINKANSFEISARNPKPWIVTHPLYGTLLLQPTSLSFDDTKHNVSKITGTLTETIADEFPRGETPPVEFIAQNIKLTNDSFALAFSSSTIPTEASKIQMKKQINKMSAISKKLLKGIDKMNDYQNYLNKANGAIDNAVSAPLLAIRAMQDVIIAPARFEANVNSRISVFKEEFESLQILIQNTPNFIEKSLFQSLASTALTGLFLSASTPLKTDYSTTVDVEFAIRNILSISNSYISDIDTIQSLNGGLFGGFVGNFDSNYLLTSLHNYTLSNLFNIASNAKQERSIVLESDSNWIVLAHRFYGLDNNDSNLLSLMKQNKAGLNNMLVVPKNSIIKYYV